jgi:CBS-domain-containing membrane protein
MKVSKCMTRDVQLVTPTQTIRDAARLMVELDAGSLPVQQDDRLVGMITDRDIAVRAVAQGKSPDTLVREVMSDEVLYCFEDQEIGDVARNMGDVKVRRLPVVNRDKRLVGIISVTRRRRTDGVFSHYQRGRDEGLRSFLRPLTVGGRFDPYPPWSQVRHCALAAHFERYSRKRV